MTIVMMKTAANEVDASFNYYNTQKLGLGGEFLIEFRHGLDRIIAYPNAWGWVDRLHRRYRLKRFPYGIIYRHEPVSQKIIIVGVVHNSRHRGIWQGREL